MSTPYNTIYSTTIMMTAKKKTKKKRCPGCLAHAVIGMFYSVVANQCQPLYTYNVLQRRCQPRPAIICIFQRKGGGHTNPCATSKGERGCRNRNTVTASTTHEAARAAGVGGAIRTASARSCTAHDRNTDPSYGRGEAPTIVFSPKGS